MIGAFSYQNNVIDIYIVLAAGVLGYVLRKLGFSLASMLVGLVLGPLIEKYLLQGLYLGSGNPLYFVSSPIAAVMWALVAIVVIGGALLPTVRRRRERDPAVASSD
jgi:putative tricarboxylic transport membrane protein